MTVWYLYIALQGCCSAPQWNQITIPQDSYDACYKEQQDFITQWRANGNHNDIHVACIRGYIK
jgi:hypothetical protein